MREDICLTTLPMATKRAVWAAIQADAPALAELLTSTGFQDIAQHFNARVVVHWADLPASAREALRESGRSA